METGITQIYELTGSKGGITARVTVTEEFDPLANTSCLTVAVGVKSSAYYNYTYYLTGALTVNGITLATMDSAVPTHYVTPGSLNTYYRIRAQSDRYTGSPWVVEDILHNTDGSKTVTVELALKGYTTGGGGGSGWSVADSREITLTHIPRANAVAATDADIGAVSTVSVVRRSADYTHTLAYSFGTLSGFLDETGSHSDTPVHMTQTVIPFAIPEAFYGEIPHAPSGVCTLICRTWAGEAQIGEDQSCTFTVTAKRELCAPQVAGTAEDVSAVTLALTADSGKVVRYHSQLLCTVTAAAKNGAQILEKTIAGTVVEENTLTIEAAETAQVVFTATDSRGYTAAATAQLELIPYIHLTANVTVKRTHPTNGEALLTVTGNCYSGSFGAAENTLSLRCSVDGGEAVELTPVWKEGAYTLQTTLTGLDYLRSHTVQVEVTDCLEQVTQTASVGKGIPVFDWGEEDFRFNVPVSLPALTVDGQSLHAYIQAILEGG